MCSLLPSVTNGSPFQEHLPSIILPTWRTLSPGRPEQWMCRVFPSVTNEWPFQDLLLTKNFHTDLNSSTSQDTWTMNVQCLPQCIQKNGHFNTTFSVEPYQLGELSGDLNKEHAESSAQSSPVPPTNGSFKTIFWVKLLYWLQECCFPEDLNNEDRVFPSNTDECPFQDHIMSKAIVLTSRALFPRRPQ